MSAMHMAPECDGDLFGDVVADRALLFLLLSLLSLLLLLQE